MVSKNNSKAMIDINPLVNLLRKLRNPEGGCPWDIEQTHKSLSNQTIEEVYELAFAINDKNDKDSIMEELGDVLFHIVFYAQIAEEEGDYSLQDVINKVCDKMIYRHPHVFLDKTYKDKKEQLKDWETLKNSEKKKGFDAEKEVNVFFGEHIEKLSATLQAEKIQKKMASLGFDWDDSKGVLKKIAEEKEELEDAILSDDKDLICDEFGDLLFSCINLGRKLDISFDDALYKANKKFKRRSLKMIDYVGDESSFASLMLKDKEKIWQKVKKGEQ